MKGTEERGYILGSVEDIVLTLDDNAMNLQSMSASRFVGPFMDRVQKWEKSLSHISEVVEVGATHAHICFPGAITLLSLSPSPLPPPPPPPLSGLDVGPAQVDVPREHLHWRRHQSSAA